MAKLRVEKRGAGEGSATMGRLVIPLWPFLLLSLLLILAVLWGWPPQQLASTADYDPGRGRSLVLSYGGHRYAPPPDPIQRQVVLGPETLKPVAKVQGHTIYALQAGGGGGGAQRLFLRSGNELFVPLQQVPGS